MMTVGNPIFSADSMLIISMVCGSGTSLFAVRLLCDGFCFRHSNQVVLPGPFEPISARSKIYRTCVR
jgi:hypothetical protein